MLKTKTTLVATMACALLACTDENTTSTNTKSAEKVQGLDILEGVPSDTPYAVAAVEPAPLERLLPWAEVLRNNPIVSAEELEAVIADEGEKPRRRAAAAFWLELRTNLTAEGLGSLGLSTSPRGVFYGIGFLPALRVELADASKFVAFLDRVEKRARFESTRGKLDGRDYRSYPLRKNRSLVIGVRDGHLVAGITPEKTHDTFVRELFADQPASDRLDQDVFEALATKYGYEKFSVGYFDLARVAQIVLSPEPGLNDDIFRALRPEDSPTISDACRTETLALVSKAPRIVVGADEWSPRHTSSGIVWELDDSLSAELAAAKSGAPLASSDRAANAAATVGLGFDVGTIVGIVDARAKQVRENPFQCEWYQGVNRSAEKIGTGLALLPTLFRELRGVTVIVDDIWKGDAEADVRNTVHGVMALSTPKPVETFDFLKSFDPGLEDFVLRPTGEAVHLPEGHQLKGLTNPMLVMQPNALVLSSGEVPPTGLADDLEESEGAPFFVMSVDHGKLGQRLRPDARHAVLRDLLRPRSTWEVEPLPDGVQLRVQMERQSED